jgi:hypothetical protein
MSWLNALITPVRSLVGQFFEHKAEEKQAKHERRLTTIKQDGNWEEIMAAGSMQSWKDEYWTIVLSVPMLGIAWGIALDNPEVITRVQEGFVVLSSLPEWYQYLLWIAITASFGIKGVKSFAEYMGKK